MTAMKGDEVALFGQCDASAKWTELITANRSLTGVLSPMASAAQAASNRISWLSIASATHRRRTGHIRMFHDADEQDDQRQVAYGEPKHSRLEKGKLLGIGMFAR